MATLEKYYADVIDPELGREKVIGIYNEWSEKYDQVSNGNCFSIFTI